eukprot:scaffold28782_cov36-Prasinocladus_malaysianus.AAC.1
MAGWRLSCTISRLKVIYELSMVDQDCGDGRSPAMRNCRIAVNVHSLRTHMGIHMHMSSLTPQLDHRNVRLLSPTLRGPLTDDEFYLRRWRDNFALCMHGSKSQPEFALSLLPTHACRAGESR